MGDGAVDALPPAVRAATARARQPDWDTDVLWTESLQELPWTRRSGEPNAFVELPFDLSEVLFITTANDTASILPPLRDRLEVIDLPGYTEDQKVVIAATHLIPAQNRAAGLADTPVPFTRAAYRRLARDHTREPGIRQLARCRQSVCRKVALAHETGDAARVPRRITAHEIPGWLGQPPVDTATRRNRRVPGFPKTAAGAPEAASSCTVRRP